MMNLIDIFRNFAYVPKITHSGLPRNKLMALTSENTWVIIWNKQSYVLEIGKILENKVA